MSEVRTTASGEAGRLSAVRGAISEAARAVGRDPAGVALVAVSKTQPAEMIIPLLDLGQRIFGENRVQEAKGKWPGLREHYSGIEMRLIGPLQTNKVRDALSVFDVIETVDRERLALALAEEGSRIGRMPRCYVQVNTGEESQKAGVIPRALEALLEYCRETCQLPVEGLMCIPPVDEEPALHFALLAELARRHGLPYLSMGMSADFAEAVRFGATSVRIGTALFGERAGPALVP